MTKLTKGSIQKINAEELRNTLSDDEEKTLIVKIPASLHMEVKKYAVLNGIKIKDYIKNLLEKDLR